MVGGAPDGWPSRWRRPRSGFWHSKLFEDVWCSPPLGATVAIFPFAIAPEDWALLPLRERIADLLALRLQGETAPRPLDAAALRRSLGDQWNVVSPAQDAALRSPRRAFTIATMLIVGDVIGSAASLTVHARVPRVSDGT